MSFNFNSVNNFNQPSIQQTQKTSDGGAGNTGYFQQGEQEEEEKDERDQEEFDKSIFDENDDDSFLQSSDTDLAKIIFNKFKKLFGKK